MSQNIAKVNVITVNTTLDENDGVSVGKISLRDAITAANSSSGADIIRFDASLTGKTIGLTNGALNIATDITISGLGQDKLTISGNQKSSVFFITDNNRNQQKNVVLENLKITGSNSGGSAAITSTENLTINNSNISGNTFAGTSLNNWDDSFPGAVYTAAGIASFRGTLNINNSTITSNSASLGGAGAIFTTGTTTITNTNISGNSSEWRAGGIYSKLNNPLTIINSTISNNKTWRTGGGIYSLNPLNLINSTVSGNQAERGGGIFTQGTTNVTNSTISGNIASDEGGGILNSGRLRMTNATITANSADSGAGLTNLGTATVGNTIIAGNSDTDISDYNTINSSGNNLIGSGDTDGFSQASDRLNVDDPGLLPLAFNGGLTQTHALKSDSLAINGGNNSLVPTGTNFDQRGAGFSRILGGSVDIGAFESNSASTTSKLKADSLIGGVKTLVGTANPDSFALGDGNQAYYDQTGNKDYALIVNFKNNDTIKLHGDMQDYVLAAASGGTGIYLNSSTQHELLGIVAGNVPLNLASANFTYL